LLEPLLLKAIALDLPQQKELLSNRRQGNYQNILDFVSQNYPTHLISLLKETIRQRNRNILNTKYTTYFPEYNQTF